MAMTGPQALARLDAALAQSAHRRPGHQRAVLRYGAGQHMPLPQAKLDTALIEREREVLFNQDKLGLELAVAAAVAQTVLSEQAQQSADPFSRTDGFHSHGAAAAASTCNYPGRAGGGHPALCARRPATASGRGRLTSPWRPPSTTMAAWTCAMAACASACLTTPWAKLEYLFTRRGATRNHRAGSPAHAGQSGNEGGRLTAPMPGKVVSFAVNEGHKSHQGTAPGGDGSHEDGAHRGRPGRWRGGRSCSSPPATR